MEFLQFSIYMKKMINHASQQSNDNLLLLEKLWATATASGTGVLTTDLEVPGVAQTAVHADTLEALQVVAKNSVNVVGSDLQVGAVLGILATVQEPHRDVVIKRVLDNRHNALNFVVAQFTGTLHHVNLCTLANKVSKATANTTNLRQCEHRLDLAVNVRVENTADVDELTLRKCKRHG